MWYDSLMTDPEARQSSRTIKYRDDIDPKNTWLVSDTHFGHDNIVGFCLRPEDHEQAMIAEWRKEVPDTATVLHLGDLNYGKNARFKNLIARELTGERKLLIQGNHDHQRFSFYKASGFSLVRPFSIKYPSRLVLPHPDFYRISFSHYPWNPDEDGVQSPYDIRIHGHIHNNGYTRDAYVPFLRNHINLSVEQTHYKPVNLGLLLDAYLYGEYPETTNEQRDEARARREERKQNANA
jgi:calcineurin-like phosphoesterase family protein